jgi:signal peptidase I
MPMTTEARAEETDLNDVDAAAPEAAPKRSVTREYFESIVVTLIMALFGITFVMRSVNVPTGSMQNTIYSGDFLLVNKFIFGYSGGLSLNGVTPHRDIKRGDIIVFKFPQGEEQNYVKRVIGMPGETIELRGHRVYINGKELPETRVIAENDPEDDGRRQIISEQKADQATYKAYYNSSSDYVTAEREDDPQDLPQYNNGRYKFYENEAHYGIGAPFKIPENCYFAMGDNRDNSLDSRFWGPVPRDYIIGRPLFVYASFKNGDSDPEPSLLGRLRKLFSQARWGRVGTLVK